MAFSKGYRDFVIEQLERAAPVTAQAVFGGEGKTTLALLAHGAVVPLAIAQLLPGGARDSRRGRRTA